VDLRQRRSKKGPVVSRCFFPGGAACLTHSKDPLFFSRPATPLFKNTCETNGFFFVSPSSFLGGPHLMFRFAAPGGLKQRNHVFFYFKLLPSFSFSPLLQFPSPGPEPLLPAAEDQPPTIPPLILALPFQESIPPFPPERHALSFPLSLRTVSLPFRPVPLRDRVVYSSTRLFFFLSRHLWLFPPMALILPFFGAGDTPFCILSFRLACDPPLGGCP